MVRDSGIVHFGLWTGATLDTLDAAKGGEVTTKEWQHIAGTYDGKTLIAYLDGEVVATKEHVKPGPTWNGGETPLHIGACPRYSEYTNGIIDEVVIFNKALIDGEIRTLMNAGLANIMAGQEVSLSGKLSTAWGNIKRKLQ